MNDKAKTPSKEKTRRKPTSAATQAKTQATAANAPSTSDTDKTISDTAVYEVLDNRSITLEVTIGDGQVGATNLRLNGVPVPFPNQHAPVQVGPVIKGSVLDCISLVHDVNPQTNHTSVTYDLRGGVEPKTYAYTLDASENGQVRYEISFLLV